MLLPHLSLPFYLKNSDLIEKNVILRVLEMLALGTTLMTVSIWEKTKNESRLFIGGKD